MSGPACEICGVQFSGEKQLEEHQSGKRHAQAAAIAASSASPVLAIECRQAPLAMEMLRLSFDCFGTISRATLEANDPLTGKRPPENAKGGPWYAAVVYTDAAAAAKALGQRYLYVGGKRVYIEPVM